MGFTHISTISEAIELQYKAIMTLYKYTDDLKKTTNEILGNMNDIVADTEINKMDIYRHDRHIKMMMAEIENINIKMRNDRIHFLCYLIIIIICAIIPLFYHL